MTGITIISHQCVIIAMTFILSLIQALAIAINVPISNHLRIVTLVFATAGLFMFYSYIRTLTRKSISSYNSIIYACAREEFMGTIRTHIVKEERIFSIAESHEEDAVSIRISNLTSYVRTTLLNIGFCKHEIHIVQQCMIQLSTNSLPKTPRMKPIQRNEQVSQTDLKHLAWNIGKVLNVSGEQSALFAHVAFKGWFDSTTIETTRRTLRENRGASQIDLFDNATILRMRTEPNMVFADKKEEGSSGQ